MPHEPVLVEACIDSVASAVAAQAGGAGRLELCADLVEGGTTPSLGLLAAVRAAVDIPIHVLIRPRGGDFVYDAAERAVMRRDIAEAKRAGADGVVIGGLTVDGIVDAETVRDLIVEARPLTVVFHRAIDLAADPLAALDAVKALGCDLVLSSGAAPTALDGVETLAAMVRRAGARPAILAGGRITAANAADVIGRGGVRQIHVRGAERADGPMRFRRVAVHMGKAYTPDEYAREVTSAARIAEIVQSARA